MRKLTAILIFFSFCWIVKAEELRIITSDGLQGIADASGQVIIPAIYQRLGWSDGSDKIIQNSIGYHENGHWGLINIKSKKNTSAKYQLLKPYNEKYFEAGIRGRFSNQLFKGIIDEKGHVIIDFKYFTINPVFEDLLIVSEYKNGGLKYGVLRMTNKNIAPIRYAGVEPIGYHLSLSLSSGKKQLMNLDGQILLPTPVDEISLIDKGYLVRNQGYQGLLSTDGRLIHDIQWKSVQDVPVSFPSWQVHEIDGLKIEEIRCDSLSLDESTDILIAHVNDAQHFLGASDLLLEDTHQSLVHIANGFMVTKDTQSSLWSIFKTSGKVVLQDLDSVVVDQDYFYYLNDQKWHVLNSFGRKINRIGYQQIGSSVDRNIPAKKNEYWGWVDFQGNILAPFKFDSIISNYDQPSHFIAKNYGSWGVRAFDKFWVLQSEYDEINPHSGFYFARKNSNWLIFDQFGKLIGQVPFTVQFEDIIRLLEQGKFGLVTENGVIIYPNYKKVFKLYGYYILQDNPYTLIVDANGSTILGEKDQVSEVVDYAEGYFQIIKDGKHGFVDENGKLRIANRYDSAGRYSEGLAPVSLLGRWGFIDAYENLVIQPLYDQASTFEDGRAVIQSNDKFGLINSKGVNVLETEWKSIRRLETGNYLIENESGKYGLADSRGSFLIRPSYDELTDSAQNLIIVRSDQKFGVLDYQGFTKVPIDYRQIQIKGDYLLLAE